MFSWFRPTSHFPSDVFASHPPFLSFMNFLKLSQTFKFLCIFNFHELSQTFSDFLSIFHYFSWFRTFAAWSEGPFSQVFHNESSHDRQGRSLNVFLCFRAVSSWVLLRSLDHVLRQGCSCIYLKNLTQGVLPKGAISCSGRSQNVCVSSSTLYILHRRCCEFYEWFTGRGFVLKSYFWLSACVVVSCNLKF